eukprot:TRINITY_DN68504_c0_g1_i1.p1 TRINITY_DN68504_c0_g1~~TRINITY_DN68504_c0_g1_i1.p1  ORF type:complete len:369 (-),score=145.09 TRINITY_DN68504_c0_g1_i1:14-1120(-)
MTVDRTQNTNAQSSWVGPFNLVTCSIGLTVGVYQIWLERRRRERTRQLHVASGTSQQRGRGVDGDMPRRLRRALCVIYVLLLGKTVYMIKAWRQEIGAVALHHFCSDMVTVTLLLSAMIVLVNFVEILLLSQRFSLSDKSKSAVLWLHRVRRVGYVMCGLVVLSQVFAAGVSLIVDRMWPYTGFFLIIAITEIVWMALMWYVFFLVNRTVSNMRLRLQADAAESRRRLSGNSDSGDKSHQDHRHHQQQQHHKSKNAFPRARRALTVGSIVMIVVVPPQLLVALDLIQGSGSNHYVWSEGTFAFVFNAGQFVSTIALAMFAWVNPFAIDRKAQYEDDRMASITKDRMASKKKLMKHKFQASVNTSSSIV